MAITVVVLTVIGDHRKNRKHYEPARRCRPRNQAQNRSHECQTIDHREEQVGRRFLRVVLRQLPRIIKLFQDAGTDDGQ